MTKQCYLSMALYSKSDHGASVQEVYLKPHDHFWDKAPCLNNIVLSANLYEISEWRVAKIHLPNHKNGLNMLCEFHLLNPFQIFLIVLTLTTFGFGVYGVTQIETDYDSIWYMDQGRISWNILRVSFTNVRNKLECLSLANLSSLV